MNQELADLYERIGEELRAIERTVQRTQGAWDGAQRFPDQQDYYLDSVALNLHSFYNGLERIFELIARRIDVRFPTGESWHHDLLWQMAQELPGVRPAVLSAESAALLDEFLAFRHRVRNLYTFNLDKDRLGELVSRLSQAMELARSDLEGFRSLLYEAASIGDTA